MVVLNKPYRVIKEDEDVCILYVYGNDGNVDMGDILLYNGGYICPKHNDLSQHTSLHSTPVGNDEGDIVFLLVTGLIGNDTMADLLEIADDQIILWGNTERYPYSSEYLESLGRTELLLLMHAHGYEDGYQRLSTDTLRDQLSRVVVGDINE